LVFGAAGLVHALRYLLLPFVFAGGAAAALDPAVKHAVRRFRLPRWVVATGVLAAALIATGGVGWWGFDKSEASVQRAMADPPGELHAFIAQSLGRETIPVFGHQITAQEISDRVVAGIRQRFGDDLAATLGRVAMGAIFAGVLFFVLFFYFLAQGPDLAQAALSLAPPENRLRLARLMDEAYPLLQRYFCGIFIIVAFTTLATWVCIGPIFHLPCPVALAILTGVLEMVPVIGPTASMTLLCGAAFSQGRSLWSLAGFGVFCFGLRFGIDQVVGPVVLGRAVKLPPVVVIFAFLAGGAVLGPLGILIAIPAVAVGKIALDDYYEN
jgi:predicted PurR-regulated permease PerM